MTQGVFVAFARPGLFRLLLAVMVVASHMSRYDIGRLAVLLFFFLSGFWVSKIWRERFDGDVWRFYGSRALRIYPLYWLVAAAGVFAVPKNLTPSTFVLFGISNIGGDPLWVSWSLDIELQFYLVLPLLMMLPARSVLPVSFLLAVASWLLAPHVLTVAHFLPAFTLGMACYIEDWKPSQSAAMLSLVLFAGTSLFAYEFARPFVDKTIPDPFSIHVFSFFWMLPLLPFVAWSLRLKSNPADRHLGNLSYPLYLVHTTVFTMLSLSRPVEFAAAGMVAIILYVGFDRIVDAWRVRVFERPPAAARA